MPVLIPIEASIPNQTFATAIDGTLYIINARWNGTSGAWYLDLLDEVEDPIWHGRRVTLGVFIGGRSRDARRPVGAFVAVDTTDEGREAGLDDISTRVLVYFYTLAELTES